MADPARQDAIAAICTSRRDARKSPSWPAVRNSLELLPA